MEEVLGVAVVEGLHQLPGQALDVELREGHHPGVQESAEVVVAVLKHEVERSCGGQRTTERGGGSRDSPERENPRDFPLLILIVAQGSFLDQI